MTVHRQRLLDVEREIRGDLSRCTDIVPLARDLCLRCGHHLERIVFGQLPLFRSHGYGAVLQTRTLICRACDWSRVADVTEANPRAKALAS